MKGQERKRMLSLNKRIAGLQPSKSVTLMEKTKAMQRKDSSIINLTGGEPDFPTPMEICLEAARQMEQGFTHYTDGPGIPELREAIAKKLQVENQAPFTEKQVIVTPGAKFGVYLAVQAVLNPGDEAIWLTPGWVSYPSIIEASGGVPVAVHLKWEEDYRITYEALEEAVSEKTKMLIINYPNNPTGKVLSASDRDAIAKFMRQHPDLVLLSDEIYEKIIYPGYEAVSMASYPDLASRVIIINGFSKCSAMTGWRLGYLACCDEIYKVIMKLFQHTMSCTSGFLQKAAVLALDCREETERMRQEYEKRSRLLYEGINKLPHVEMLKPEGAFYAWVTFDLGKDSEEVCNLLLDEAKIAGVPGIAYGEEDKVCVRFSYAASEECLKQMLKNLEKLLRDF